MGNDGNHHIEASFKDESNNLNLHEANDRDEYQHSFMQESSLQNLFAGNGSNIRGGVGMMHLESGFEDKSGISRPGIGSSGRTLLQNLP